MPFYSTFVIKGPRFLFKSDFFVQIQYPFVICEWKAVFVRARGELFSFQSASLFVIRDFDSSPLWYTRTSPSRFIRRESPEDFPLSLSAERSFERSPGNRVLRNYRQRNRIRGIRFRNARDGTRGFVSRGGITRYPTAAAGCFAFISRMKVARIDATRRPETAFARRAFIAEFIYLSRRLIYSRYS